MDGQVRKVLVEMEKGKPDQNISQKSFSIKKIKKKNRNRKRKYILALISKPCSVL